MKDLCLLLLDRGTMVSVNLIYFVIYVTYSSKYLLFFCFYSHVTFLDSVITSFNCSSFLYVKSY